MSRSLATPYRRQRTATIVGVVGLFAFGAVLWGSFAGSGLIRVGGSSVQAIFDEGLNLVPRSSEVRVRGLPVGRVETVELRNGRTVATLRLGSGVDLRADATAKTRLKSLLGEKYVDLHPGKSPRKLVGPINRTTVGTDVNQLARGAPPKKDSRLSRAELFDTIEEAAAAAPDEKATLQAEIQDYRRITDELVAGQASLLLTIDDLASLTDALVASSAQLGVAQANAQAIQRRIEAEQRRLQQAFARADTAVKIIRGILHGRAREINLALDRFEIVFRQGKEAFALFRAGATLPTKIFGLGPIGQTDTRKPGPNPQPPAPTFTLPPDPPGDE